MLHIQNQIKENPDRQLSEKSLAARCVGASRVAGNASLRTQNKYFPNHEPMVIGSLIPCDAAIRAGFGGTKHKALIKCRRFLSDCRLGCLKFRTWAVCFATLVRPVAKKNRSNRRLPTTRPAIAAHCPNLECRSPLGIFVRLHERSTEPARATGPQPATDTTMRCR